MIFGASGSRRSRSTRAIRRAPETEAAHDEPLPPKLIPSLRSLFHTGTSLLHTRLALAGVELEEEIQRMLGVVVMAGIAGIAALMALVVLTFTIVAAVPEDHRVVTMIVITLVYLVLAVVMALRI